MATIDPPEAMARALVAATIPALEEAMLCGARYSVAMAEAWRRLEPDWQARHGVEVARRAGQILRQVGPAAILTPYGREVFFRDYPLSAIPMPAPVEAIVTPRGGIGSRMAQAFGSFWRVPPASKA